MEFSLTGLSSLKDDDNPVYIQPHYKETYRLAIYALLCGGKEAYEEFLRAEQISHFLSEEEILFILENAELPVSIEEPNGRHIPEDLGPSTYFPTESDEEVPDLDLGWPEVTLDSTETSISLLFHPPRENTPSIKEVVRKQIQEAKEVIAIAMDVFTDVDIFKEIISATLRGVAVYILLDKSHFRSFFTMSQRVGINIQDFKNIRVRTVQGQQYRCQSGVKFHGGLEQKFILVDCQTVLYGTYSYTWSFEKINLSMVLVVTGQLVCSYDEEFRRLYARSAIPTALSRENLAVQYPRDTMALHSPNSSQLSLHQIHMKSRLMHGLRSAQDDKYNNLNRGVSVQDRLHQSHCPDLANLVRGHSYGADLQKLSSMTRLRMGTKDLGIHIPPERTGTNMRGGGNSMLTNRVSQQHLKHRSRYGADQHLIPFNSETSLHKWKIDTYLNGGDAQLDGSGDTTSPLMSPYSSHTGLNENQSQMIHSRSRDIKSRLEEMRQKRFSLQEYANFRKSQESLRSMFPTLERPKKMSSLRGLEIKQSEAELDPKPQYTDEHKDEDVLKNECVTSEQMHTDGQRLAPHYDVKMVPEQKTTPTYDWYEPLSRTVSAAELDMKLSEPSLKLSYLQPSGLGLQPSRVMESLTELPEEKDGPNVHVYNSSPAPKDGHEGVSKDDNAAAQGNSVKSSSHLESRRQDAARGEQDSAGKMVKRSDLAAAKEGKKRSGEEETSPKILNNPAESQHTAEAQSTFTEKQREEQVIQRKNSMRLKVYSMLSPEERRSSKKEDKSPQRKPSLRSKNPIQLPRMDNSQTSGKPSPPNPLSKKVQRSSLSKSHNDVSSQTDTEKHKSPFPIKLSPQRSSKRKTGIPAEQDKGSRSTLEDDGATANEATRETAYSRFEYFLSAENISLDKAMSTNPSDNDRNSFMNSLRNDSGTNLGNSVYQSHGGADNRLGRFMQRFGNLISKNK